MNLLTIACLLMLLSVVPSRGAISQELPLVFSFDESSKGWANQSPLDEHSLSEWATTAGRSGGGIHLKATAGKPDQMRPWRTVLRDPSAGKRLRFSAWVKGNAVETVVSLVVQAHASNDGFSTFGAASTQANFPLKGDFDWTRIETTADVPPGTKNLQVLLLLVGNGEVWFDDVEIHDVGDAGLIAPGIFQTRGKASITTHPTQPAVRIVPLPLSYQGQVPLSYSLDIDPPDRFIGATTQEDRPGNWTLRLTLAPPLVGAPNTPIIVEWSSLVLIGPSLFDDVPKTAAFPNKWPEEAAAWLVGTRCVQADNDRIQAVARAHRADSNDVMDVISQILAAAKSIIDQQTGTCTTLDAVEALDKKGSCTSRANLLAALLRASGVPARILAGYPAWSGPLQTHFIVEAYVPGYGWYPIEPTKLCAPWPRHEQVQVAIVPPEYENRSESRDGIADGVPYLSVDEHAPGSAPFVCVGVVSQTKPHCDHETVVLRNLPGDAPKHDWTGALAAATAVWESWLVGQRSAGTTTRWQFRPTAFDVLPLSLGELRKAVTQPANPER